MVGGRWEIFTSLQKSVATCVFTELWKMGEGSFDDLWQRQLQTSEIWVEDGVGLSAASMCGINFDVDFRCWAGKKFGNARSRFDSTKQDFNYYVSSFHKQDSAECDSDLCVSQLLCVAKILTYCRLLLAINQHQHSKLLEKFITNVTEKTCKVKPQTDVKARTKLIDNYTPPDIYTMF